MADPINKEQIRMIGRQLLNAQAQAAEHIRSCSRCQRLFLVAFEAAAEQLDQAATIHSEVWLLTRELLREFRQCSDWPRGA